MPNDKKTEFVVTDRRKFTLDGEARPDAEPESREEQEEAAKVVEMPRAAAAEPTTSSQSAPPQPAEQQEELSPPPTAEETKASTDAYNASTKQIDERLEKELKAHGGGRKLSDFEMNFEKFIASIYMSALMQLGLVADQGSQPRADIIGARQTIDTLAILAQKTKGNLTDREDTMLQNVLYELRMAYIEVTNAIARGPQPGGPSPAPGAGLK